MIEKSLRLTKAQYVVLMKALDHVLCCDTGVSQTLHKKAKKLRERIQVELGDGFVGGDCDE